MSKFEKLVERFRLRPKDFTWGELVRLLAYLGYVLYDGAGSRRKFYNRSSGRLISIHEPHPRSELKRYQMDQIRDHLEQEGLL